MSVGVPSRVGLYIQAETRDRLNELKERLAKARTGKVSQDDAIAFLLDVAVDRGKFVAEDYRIAVANRVGKGLGEVRDGEQPTAEAVGRRVYSLREAAGLTQEELIERMAEIGITFSQTHLSQIEKGRSLPGAEKIAALARIFGVSADYLLLLSDKPVANGDNDG